MQKAYGRRFLASLPGARLVHDLADVKAFFTEPERAAPRPLAR